MPVDNVELVHRVIDAYNRQDLAALTALSDPEVEFVNSPSERVSPAVVTEPCDAGAS